MDGPYKIIKKEIRLNSLNTRKKNQQGAKDTRTSQVGELVLETSLTNEC